MQRVSGRVVTATSEQPIAGALVMIQASPQGHRDLSQISNASGAFSFNLGEGVYQMQVYAKGFAPRKVTADNSAGPIDLTIRLQESAVASSLGSVPPLK